MTPDYPLAIFSLLRILSLWLGCAMMVYTITTRATYGQRAILTLFTLVVFTIWVLLILITYPICPPTIHN